MQYFLQVRIMVPVFVLFCYFIIAAAVDVFAAAQDGPDISQHENHTVCDQIAFVTTIRTSEYFADKMTMRAGISSYRVFRDSSVFSRDLTVAVVIDNRISQQQKFFLLADLRSYETRFAMYPSITEEGHLDAVPDYVYGLRAFKSMNDSTACQVLYVSPKSLFFKDPTEFLVFNSDVNTPAQSGVHCLRQRDEFENSVVEKFLASVGLSTELLALATEAKGANQYPILCNPDLILFSIIKGVQRFLDISDSMSADYSYQKLITTAVSGSPVAPLPPRHEFESILLHITLLTIVSSSRLVDKVGKLPSYLGTDLSAWQNNQSAEDGGLSELYIMLYPAVPGSGKRANLRFSPPDGKGGLCSVDVSQWRILSESSGTPHYLRMATVATRTIRDTPYACEVLANSVSAVPFADFLEFGSRQVSIVSRPWHFGVSLSIVPYSDLISSGADNYYYRGLSQLTESFGSRSTSLLHISSTSCDASVTACSDFVSSEDLLNDFVTFYESIPPTQLHVIQRKLPCVVWVENVTCSDVAGRLESRLYRLGYIPSTHMCSSHQNEFILIGPHCYRREFERILLLMPFQIASEVSALWQESTEAHIENKLIENELNDGAVPIGVLVADEPGQEFKIIDDPIPSQLVDLLVGRLMHKTFVQKDVGANSYFVKFDGSKPRSLIESYILDHLAPLVVGPLDVARRNGFIGAEWWTQQRAEDDPKEYHMDTAITWCRDNGWPDDLLSACFFYPAIGSIVYLTDEGGPTAVFNQTPGIFGMEPLVPSEVALIFPKRNRLMLFNGAKYHGVMRKKPCVPSGSKACLPRVTLLVNYWREKSAGESYTTTVPQEVAYQKQYDRIVESQKNKDLARERDTKNTKGVSDRKWSSLHELEFAREFATDFLSWKNNNVPPVYMEGIASMFQGFSYHDGRLLYTNSSTTPDEEGERATAALTRVPPPGLLLKLHPGDTIQTVADSSGLNFDHWPRWGVHEGMLVMKNVDVKISDLNEWRNSMPGGNPLAEKYESLKREELQL